MNNKPKKSKLKSRLKIIKLFVLLFVFLVFFSIFLGLNSTNKKTKNVLEENSQEKISSIIPREFKLVQDDYKILRESQNTGDSLQVSYDNNPYLSQEYNSRYQSMDNVPVPTEFSAQNNSSYGRENRKDSLSDNGTIQNRYSPIDNALAKLSEYNKRIDDAENNPTNIGMKSGIFVGKNSGGGVLGSNNVISSATDKLGNLFENLGSANLGAGFGSNGDTYNTQNNQHAKENFIAQTRAGNNDFSLKDKGKYLKKEEELFVIAGSIIPMVLVTAINSDLPGMISARVTEDVYDSFYGRYIIIPKGTMVIGKYDSSVTWGQKRVLVVWSRLTRPDGYTLNLEAMQGADQQGASGVSGNVKTYVGGSIASAFLTSAFSLGIHYTSYSAGTLDNTGGLSSATNDAGNSIRNTFSNLANKFLNRQPTIHIKQGTVSFVFVNKDISMPEFKRGQ